MKRVISFLLSFVFCCGMMPQILLSANAASTYVINGKSVRYDDFSSSESECWVYANNIYNKIWGCKFNNKFDDSSNSLRNLSDSELTLTKEHLKAYVTNAKLGSCLRICDSKYLHGNDGWGHSQIIVQIDENGFTVLEGGLTAAPHCREKYYTWSKYCDTWDYEYIKYIKWPSAPVYVSCDHTTDNGKTAFKDCGVCSECGHIFDWESTFTSATMGEYKVTSSITPRADQPYDAATKSSFKLTSGTKVKVLGSCTNAYKNTWYKAEVNGEICYIYKDYLSFVKYYDLNVTCANFSPANDSVLEKKAQPVKGTVTSNYPLKTIEAYLDGKLYATWTAPNQSTTTVELRSTDINNDLNFAEQSTGKHTLVLKATDYAHSGSVTFHSSVFYMEEKTDCAHSYTSKVTTAATCGKAGVRTYTCSSCGKSYTESISATGNHSYGSWTTVKAATCTASGSQQRKCTNCTATETKTVSATGHSYGNWVTTTAATCTATGTQKKTCSSCGATQTQSIAAKGHSYGSKLIAATCIEYEKLQYTCSRCGHSYSEYTATKYSEWSTAQPVGVPDEKIQSKKQYRYSDYETITSEETSVIGYSQTGSKWVLTDTGWLDYIKSWPSGYNQGHGLYSTYNKSPKTASETTTSKTTIDSEKIVGYIYYHWCRGTYTNGPINRRIEASKTGQFVAFHSFFSTTDPSTLTADTDDSYVLPNADCCKDSHWYFAIPIYRQSYTSYKKQFTYTRWTEWSAWSDTAYTASSTRKVETRTLYRYLNEQLGDHTYVNDICVHCGAQDPDAVVEIIRMEMTSVTASPGDTVTVAVNAVDNPGFAGFSVVFAYDTNALTLTDISKGELLAGSESGMFTKNVAGAALNWTDSTNTYGNGTMFYLTFRINDAASAGQYEIAMYLKDHEPTNFVDENGKRILTVNRFAVITAEEKSYIPGDINGNGEVNRDDVVDLLLHVSSGGLFPISVPADYNGDGVVTRDDVITLLLYVSTGGAFPLA